jgi:hypothetical protein
MSKRTSTSTTAWTSSSSSNPPLPPAPPTDSWPIQLYRYIPSTGWELYQDNQSSSTVWSSIYATPKKNCVEIKQLRLRIHLFARPTETNDRSSSNKNNNNKDDTAATSTKVSNPATTLPSSYHATVVQRKDTLLIVGEQGIQQSVNGTRVKCHMNLSFPVIWEPDECGSSHLIGIGALDVKFYHLE